MRKPRIAITLGDVAGIGPEVTARALADPRVVSVCDAAVIGDPLVVARAVDISETSQRVVESPTLEAAFDETDGRQIGVWNPSGQPLSEVPVGIVSGPAGQAAHDWLVAAIDAARAGRIDAITTAPLSKAALHSAGLKYPGHTEILAERCGVKQFAMMLYVPSGGAIRGPAGLGIAHVTLHTSIASVPGLLSTAKIEGTIGLVDDFMRRLGCKSPRIGVCALNPHAGEEGLFGDEESRIIAPAVAKCPNAAGPFPTDTLIRRAVHGEFDGLVAMYHDQGHIALKLIAFGTAVNVTLGLPIVRTSPSHGTGFDIAWQGRAEATGMIEAILAAARLC